MMAPVYTGVMYMFMLWVFMSSSVDGEIPTITTFGGTGRGANCVFPYFYQGQWNFECRSVGGHAYVLCATTANMDADNLYGYCRMPSCKVTTRGREYMGTVSSSYGYACQRWDSQSPHSHSYTNPSRIPDDTLSDSANYCRNPDNDYYPWCILSTPYWFYGYCTVPTCTQSYWCSGELQASVPDGDFSASSSESDRPPADVRLSSATGWCANETDTDPHVQVDFSNWKVISYIEVKGESNSASRKVTEYMIQYLSHDLTSWATYSTLDPGYTMALRFVGNGADAATAVGHGFHPPIWTKSIRIVPTQWSDNAPCLRAAIVGCSDSPGGYTPSKCINGGTSVLDGPSATLCQCPPSYVGSTCEIHVTACMSQPCENGGTCVNDAQDPINVRSCTCLSMYSGADCEIGHATSCSHVVQEGGTDTGLYTLKLFDGSLTDPCTMIHVTEPALWRSDGVTFSVTATQSECEAFCMSDPSCVYLLYDSTSGTCHQYNDTDISGDIITVDSTQTSALFVKDCPSPVQLLCNMTNPAAPVLEIPHQRQGNLIVELGRPETHYLLYQGISQQQIKLLLDAAYCDQSVELECAELVHDNWAIQGQVTSLPLQSPIAAYDAWCSCVFTESCSVDGDSCSCNKASPYEDSGRITDHSLLPVTRIHYDNTVPNNRREVIVGPLICSEGPVVDECLSSPCQHGGICMDGVYDFTCSCATGYTGKTCSIEVNECLSGPCLNGATCSDLPAQFHCTCAAGYIGDKCQTDIDECHSSPCSAEASCLDLVAEFQCLCKNGFVGEKCEIDVDECASTPCQHGGSCTQGRDIYTCVCEAAYEGTNCENEVNFCDSGPCLHQATCVPLLGDYGCQCVAGYTGTNCETDVDDCAAIPCENNGACTDDVNGFTCTCLPGYTGVTCQTDMDECGSGPCQNGAECVDRANAYECLCTAGYLGTVCDIDIDECSSDPCVNGGTCVDEVNGYTCQCASGFQGSTCSSEVNECISSPCLNGGTCQDHVNSFTCTCRSGFTGRICDLFVIDGEWGGWSEWGECSNQCGQGVNLRTRKCTNPRPQNGGNECRGTMTDRRDCEQFNCENVNGNWGLWGEFSPCSSTCGPGSKRRTRMCNNPTPTGTGEICPGSHESVTYCNTIKCGVPRDGYWSTWGDWSACDVTCGLGTVARYRRCDSPPPVYGGKDCTGNPDSYKPCKLTDCPATLLHGPWSEWGQCSATCGDGTKSRTRVCTSDPSGNTAEATVAPTEYSVQEYNYKSCQSRPCNVMKCYHCEGVLDYRKERLTCKGPAKACPADKPYCKTSFSHQEGQVVVQKGCSDLDECGTNITGMCDRLRDLTYSSIITESAQLFGPLEPHVDTIQMSLNLFDECTICCTRSKCNRGMVPQGDNVLTDSAATWRFRCMDLLPIVIALVFH